MKRAEGNHWTQDEEMLERFVLNRLDVGERVEAEQHLRTCEICKRAVRTERQLAAGVRRFGRDTLRERITRIITQNESEVPWPRILSVAAVVCILTGIGVYNRWFAVKEPAQLTSMNSERRDSLSVPNREMEKNEVTNGQVTDEKSDAASSSLRTKNKRQTSKEYLPGTAIQGAEEGSMKKTELPAAGPLFAQGGKNQEAIEEHAAEMDKDAEAVDMQLSESSIWVEGTPLSAVSAGESKSAVHGADNRRMNDFQESSKQQADKLQRGAQIGQQAITLKQQSISTLPSYRQQIHKSIGQEPIQTFIEQTGKGLQLTMFLPETVAEESLKTANIEQIGDDSLIVTLGGQRIAYRIPSGWNIQQLKETGRQR